MNRDSPQSYRIEIAGSAHLSSVAAIFREAFADSLRHFFGSQLPTRTALVDVFSLLHDFVPDSFLVAVQGRDGRVLGYIVAPPQMRSVWYRALSGGYVFRWLWRWLRGEYGFGLRPLPRLAHSKLGFMRATITNDRRQGEAGAQVLSIAVSRGARGQGIGSALVAEALSRLKSQGVRLVKLEVRRDNTPARRLYERFGFRPTGGWSDSQGEWVVMVRDLNRSL